MGVQSRQQLTEYYFLLTPSCLMVAWALLAKGSQELLDWNRAREFDWESASLVLWNHSVAADSAAVSAVAPCDHGPIPCYYCAATERRPSSAAVPSHAYWHALPLACDSHHALSYRPCPVHPLDCPGTRKCYVQLPPVACDS